MPIFLSVLSFMEKGCFGLIFFIALPLTQSFHSYCVATGGKENLNKIFSKPCLTVLSKRPFDLWVKHDEWVEVELKVCLNFHIVAGTRAHLGNPP